jgi:hypothetical protein
VDERALYLARLVRDLALSPAPLIALLDGDQEDCERAAEVLELLAVSGSVESREALRDYVRDGEHWLDVLQSVANRWPVAWWDDLADVAAARSTGEEPVPWRAEPWIRWRSRFGAVTPPHPPRVREVEVGASGRRLLAVLADPGSGERARIDALRLLAHRPPEPALLPLVASLGSGDGDRPLPWLAQAVGRLGPLAVPAARAWAADGRPWLEWIGVRVLTGHGEVRDVPTLIGRLATEWAERQWCGPSLLAAGLARFGPAAAEAAPLLRRFWVRTPHSYERPSYLRALAAIDPAGLDRAHTESLWDCESEARLLGIASAPDQPMVRARLARLRDDTMEDPEVRTAAAERLTGRSG